MTKRTIGAAGLTIRNLTAQPIVLLAAEPAHRPPSEPTASPVLGALPPVERPPIPVGSIQPFCTLRTELTSPSATSPDLVVTFEIPKAEGGGLHHGNAAPGRYRLLILAASLRLTPVQRLDIAAATTATAVLTAVYFPVPALLALLAVPAPSRWMAGLDDRLSLSALSMPGTHNSAASHWALPVVRCQAVPVREQLAQGVRFLDVRVCTAYAAPKLVHSIFPVSLVPRRCRFARLLVDLYAFLEENPTEVVVLSLKREGLWPSRSTDAALWHWLCGPNGCAKRPERWYVTSGCDVPALGECRGRIVLLRRFEHSDKGEGWGVDATLWPDNVHFGKAGRTSLVHLQDHYRILHPAAIETKISFVCEHLERAASMRRNAVPAQTTLFLNFLSGGDWLRRACWPEAVAARVNRAVVEYICVHLGEPGRGPKGLSVGDSSTGVVITDWVGLHGDWDVVNCVLAANARLLEP